MYLTLRFLLPFGSFINFATAVSIANVLYAGSEDVSIVKLSIIFPCITKLAAKANWSSSKPLKLYKYTLVTRKSTSRKQFPHLFCIPSIEDSPSFLSISLSYIYKNTHTYKHVSGFIRKSDKREKTDQLYLIRTDS